VKRLYGKAFPYLVSPPECKDRLYAMSQVGMITDILQNDCPRHRQMVFSDEVSDCDDYVLQAYAEFKWVWAQTAEDGSLIEDRATSFVRLHKQHAPVGMGFGIKFRDRMIKHSVMTILAIDGMFIYDAVSREVYVTNINQDIVLHVSMQ
jgi:hypothetical protein